MESSISIIEREIEKKKGHIKTENVIFSIGEIINLYRDKDLKLNPDFQRFFRWTKEQKSRLIESVFLGLPIPSFLCIRMGKMCGKFWMVYNESARFLNIRGS